MKRRDFLGAALTTGMGGPMLLKGSALAKSTDSVREGSDALAGRSLEALAALCRRQLFDDYLPFWEKGGHDEEHGGFMCYLYENGTVENDRKDIWYQGRGIWVYSFLYNTLDKNPKWLERARMARDFMVRHMHRGDGTWLDTVNRFGRAVDGIAINRSNSIYGALFAAVGLIQYAKATGSEEDLALARLSLRKAVQCYENPGYVGVPAPGIEVPGLREQSCSFMMVWVIPQLLELDRDPWFETLVQEHLDALENKFWNTDYGISNEMLFHEYTRIPSLADQMIPGHSIEAQWMGMKEALRQGNKPLYKKFEERMRRLVEMSWDYVFQGTCDTGYRVFPSRDGPAGPVLDIKTMWAQSEVSIGCLMALEQTGEDWSRVWFERSWAFLQRTMTTDHGIWRQAVDRRGNDKQREGISIYRRGNFHQPRCLMYLMQILRRMMA